MKKENTTEKVTDIDYAQCAVPAEGRKGFLTMFMIMLGFTFFSASMWVGQQLAEGLDFYGFIKSLILGGMILGHCIHQWNGGCGCLLCDRTDGEEE